MKRICRKIINNGIFESSSFDVQKYFAESNSLTSEIVIWASSGYMATISSVP